MIDLSKNVSNSEEIILPGSSVIVNNPSSIYNGYKGFVQRITEKKAAVLFEGGNWDKLLTIPLNQLELL